MKPLRLHTLLRIAVTLVVASLVLPAPAQDASPQLQELLDKLPADSAAVRDDLLKLSEADIDALCKLLVEPGTGDDTKPRFALHGLALAVGARGRQTERDTFIQALANQLLQKPPEWTAKFLIEQLHLAGDAQAIEILGSKLKDEAACDDAVLAIVAIGGPSAPAVLHKALPDAEGRCRITIIHALGTLGDKAAVATFTKDAASEDRNLRMTALYALARSGDSAATETLFNAAKTDNWYDLSLTTDLLLLHGARLTELGHVKAAAGVFRRLFETRTSPSDTHVRCAAVHGLAEALGADAAGKLLPLLADDNLQLRTAAANAVAAVPGKKMTHACFRQFYKTSTVGQVMLLGVLAERGDRMGLSLLDKALWSEKKDVRLAAIPAIAKLGADRAVDPLIGALVTEERDEQEAIQAALARIPGSEATELIQSALPGVHAMTRVPLLHVLAKRPASDDLAPIFEATEDDDRTVRTAAFGALETLAGEEHVPALLKLLGQAESDRERSAAAAAVAAACRRAEDREQPTSLVVAAMQDQDTTVRCAFLRALGRTGGVNAFNAVSEALKDQEAEIREAAIRALSDWPDAEPVQLTLQLTKDLDDAKLQILALRAYIRLVGLESNRPVQETLRMYAAALETAKRPDEKKLVLGRLGGIREPKSMKMLESYLSDPALTAEAAAAILNIVDAFIPDRWVDAAPSLKKVLATELPQRTRERAEWLHARLTEYEDFITDWWVAGPYEQENTRGSEIFDTPFPPEQPDAQSVEWRKHPVNDDPNLAWSIDLRATMAGNNRAAYLKTRVYSPSDQRVRLDVGSDDGIKAWLNGELVHRNNVPRGVSPGEDKIEVSLKKGRNTLLLKVTNDLYGWGACARFRSLEGEHLEGVRANAGEKP